MGKVAAAVVVTPAAVFGTGTPIELGISRVVSVWLEVQGGRMVDITSMVERISFSGHEETTYDPQGAKRLKFAEATVVR